MGLHICYDLSLPGSTTDDSALALLERLRAYALTLDVELVTELLQCSGRDLSPTAPRPQQDHLGTDRPKTDFFWDIYPEGFGTVLDEAKGYGLPILVTENGIADQADVSRGRFLAEHLFQLGLAMQRGADVRGYFHWAMVDNFEWASGFCPKFGLHTVDKATGQRTARASARVYTGIIRAGKVRQEDIDAMPPYGAPTPCN